MEFEEKHDSDCKKATHLGVAARCCRSKQGASFYGAVLKLFAAWDAAAVARDLFERDLFTFYCQQLKSAIQQVQQILYTFSRTARLEIAALLGLEVEAAAGSAAERSRRPSSRSQLVSGTSMPKTSTFTHGSPWEKRSCICTAFGMSSTIAKMPGNTMKLMLIDLVLIDACAISHICWTIS